MSESTAVVVHGEEKQSLAEIVSAGVGETLAPARVAAMRLLLPPDFRDDAAHVIALGVRAHRSGLDPFTQIHAWKNERGQLQFQIDYRGFVEIAARDPRVDSLEFSHVYEGDHFSWHRDEHGKVRVEQDGGLRKGRLLGAYCVAHMNGTMSDHMERRLLEDYSHLHGKTNWRQHSHEMILARVISVCVRVVCPENTAGLYTQADFDMQETGETLQALAIEAARSATEAAKVELREKLGPSPTWEEREEEVAEAVVVDPTPSESEPSGSTQDGSVPPTKSAPSSSKPSERSTETSPEARGLEDEPRYPCPYCLEGYDKQRSLAGHSRAHKQEKQAEALMPDEYEIHREDDAFELWHPEAEEVLTVEKTWLAAYEYGRREVWGRNPDAVKAEGNLQPPDGYIVHQDGELFIPSDADGEIVPGSFRTWDDACLAAINHYDEMGGDEVDPTSSAPESPTMEASDDSPSTTSTSFEVPKIAELYRMVADNGFDPNEVVRVVNDAEYEDTFGKYRREGAQKITPTDLDEDGRRELVEILRILKILPS